MVASNYETAQPRDTPDVSGQNTSVIRELRHPLGLLNFFFGAVGLFGTAFGIYSFYVSPPRTTLTYSVNNQINILDQSSEAARLTIEDRVGQPVLSNVYAAEILFWNSSDRNLDHSHIRKPISFHLADGSIIDVRFKEAIQQDVSKFSFGTEPCASQEVDRAQFLRKDFSVLSWCVFDPGFGVNIVVIYENEAQTSLSRWCCRLIIRKARTHA